MRAVLCDRYGSPEALRCEDVALPAPGDREVLIEVCAASLNPLDWHLKRGRPYFMRLMTGLRRPRDARLGVDVAGRVEAVGRSVTTLAPGDEVFGSCRGAFAEYACAPETTLIVKPDHVPFEQAAAVPVAAYTALQGLRDTGKVRAGQQVLINGAAGGVGTLAVQVARWLGAEVTGVCGPGNVEMVRSLGAGRVIDYSREDFTAGGPRYDVVFDLVGNRSLAACRRGLRPGGIYIAAGVMAGPRVLGLLSRSLVALAWSRLGNRKLYMFLARSNREDLAVAADLMQAGIVTPVIDRRYRLSEVPEAIRHLETKHARGKIVITP